MVDLTFVEIDPMSCEEKVLGSLTVFKLAVFIEKHFSVNFSSVNPSPLY